MLDPELGDGLGAEEFHEARQCCSACLIRLSRGRVAAWRAPAGEDPHRVWLLIVEGLVSCRLSVDAGHAVELLGPGDVLQPWVFDAGVTVCAETQWRVYDPVLLAVLDQWFFESAARWPPLLPAVLDRSVRRSRSTLVRLAIAEIPQVTRRVHLVLWHLADRWGKVAPAGVVLGLRLPVAALADLVCARRETVSRALSVLAGWDLVHRQERGFLLRGEPPAERHTFASPLHTRARPSS